LMEEVAHVFLGHRPNRLAAIVDPTSKASRGRITGEAADPLPESLSQRKGGAEQSSDPAKSGKLLARDYNQTDEEAAYAVGAAALVPYGALRRLVMKGRTSHEIARHFLVSRQLAEYRIKVTHLWADYKRASVTRAEHV
jgi:IrrE N-terminal-like domain